MAGIGAELPTSPLRRHGGSRPLKRPFALRGSSGCIEQEKTVCSGLRSVPAGGRVLAWVRELADAGSGPALIRRGPIFRAYPVDAQTHNCLRTGKKLRGHRALALAFSRSVAYGLDIMAIRVEHKSTVIVTMIIWSRPWSAVVAPTSGKCSRMKGIYRRTVWCREGHVRASDHRIARADPEDRLLVRAVSRKNLPLGVKPLNAKRL